MPAVVMCGSAIEAMLFNKLQMTNEQKVKLAYAKCYPTKKNKGSPGDMSFAEMIEVVEELGLMHQGHAKFADVAKDYRNLLHIEVVLKVPMRATPHAARAMFWLAWDIFNELTNASNGGKKNAGYNNTPLSNT
jgi:hypothetical protein